MSRGDPPSIKVALQRLERAASILSNHRGTYRKGHRTAGDWSRLHTAIDDARAALAAENRSWDDVLDEAEFIASMDDDF